MEFWITPNFTKIRSQHTVDSHSFILSNSELFDSSLIFIQDQSKYAKDACVTRRF